MKKRILEKIYSDIKSVKIQGATNVAKAALRAYSLDPSESNKKRLMKLRPTEPMLVNVLRMMDKLSKKKVLDHFNEAQDKINKLVYKLIKSDTFKESEITSYSFLSKQYRGPIPDLIYNIDVELFNKEKE